MLNPSTFQLRRQKYKTYRLEGMSVRSAALKAGYAYSTACVKKLDKVCDLQTELEMAGLTNKRIAKEAVEGLEATDWRGNPKWDTKHKYLETVLKVRGDLQPQAQAAANQVQVNVFIPTDKI